MRNLIFTFLICTVITISTSSCDDNVNSPDLVSVNVEISMPSGMENAEMQSESVKVKNVSTGTTTSFSGTKGLDLQPGLYDFTYDGIVKTSDEKELPIHIKAFKQSIEINTSTTVVALNGFKNLQNDDFIISEVFFTGTQQKSGNYTGDDYVKLYNNTDHVLYADGITLFESEFTTTLKYDYTPNIMNEAVTVHALYTIPGSGKDYPVQPGEYIILADNAMDHRVANPYSFDLSHANWEWYDVSSSPSNMDIDNPNVPNLDKWYCYTLSYWILHNRGFKAFGIARIPIDKDTYLKDYLYTYKYVMVLPAGTFPMEHSAYKIPNNWVIDVVNCSVDGSFAWTVTDPSLDCGWTHCGAMDRDKNRFFHSVRRKLLYINSEGNPVFQDTNNSTEDFNPDCIASEIERQGTCIDINGTLCTQKTYDGVVPIK